MMLLMRRTGPSSAVRRRPSAASSTSTLLPMRCWLLDVSVLVAAAAVLLLVVSSYRDENQQQHRPHHGYQRRDNSLLSVVDGFSIGHNNHILDDRYSRILMRRQRQATATSSLLLSTATSGPGGVTAAATSSSGSIATDSTIKKDEDGDTDDDNNNNSFHYAPNFITKIIQEQTGRQMMMTTSVADADDNDTTTIDTAHDNIATSSSSSPSSSRTIRTRFPPEPNGYLHLGHAKAVTFNYAVAKQIFNGNAAAADDDDSSSKTNNEDEFHMRFDDTNPSKESQEYVDAILEDVQWLLPSSSSSSTTVPWDGPVRHTSDYFDTIYECAKHLIKTGQAYVDSLSATEMREYRGTLTTPGRDSPYKLERSIEENLEMFENMRAGLYQDGEHVVRAKIDMASPNINLRDPVLYRVLRDTPHQRSGTAWQIYPMYDFSHPLADAIEGITHSLCTLEFEDHRPFYDWVLERLWDMVHDGGTGDDDVVDKPPQQIEFSRLNIQSTVLSKRKLIQLVDEHHVDGWDDPRMPTLAGLRRRGVPPNAIRLFCTRVGISKSDSNIAYSVFEECIREMMDTTCPRAMCVVKPLKVTLMDYEQDKTESFEVPNHPKRDEMGTRSIPFSKELFIERTDFFDVDGPEGQAAGGKPPKGFKRLLPNEGRVRLRYAYVIECHKVIRDPTTQEPSELICKHYPETLGGKTPEGMKRVPGIIHWVDGTRAVDCQVNLYDRLFRVEQPGATTDNFLDDINPNSLQVLSNCKVEPSVAQEANDILDGDNKSMSPSSLSYQFERNGYFALDKDSAAVTNAAADGQLVFNRVVTLRDTWATPKSKKGEKSKKQQQNDNKQKNAGVFDDISRVAFRVVTIVSVEQHPEADSLLVCQVDCGDTDEGGNQQHRTVVTGLAGKIPIDQLEGQRCIAVTNLKPAKMRGIESTAMLLTASVQVNADNEEIELLKVPYDNVPNGEVIAFDGFAPQQPDAMLKSKGALKAFDRAILTLGVRTSDGVGEVIHVAAKEDNAATHVMMTSGGPVQISSDVATPNTKIK